MTQISKHTTVLITALVAVSSLSTPAWAQAADPATPFAAAVSDTALQGIAGREDVSQISQAEQNAMVTKNSVGSNSVTGEVHIADNSFQNLSGLSLRARVC